MYYKLTDRLKACLGSIAMPWALCLGLYYLFIHLAPRTTYNTYDNNDMLDLKLYLLRYYRLLTDNFIKWKISSLNDLEGLFVTKPSKFFPYFADVL